MKKIFKRRIFYIPLIILIVIIALIVIAARKKGQANYVTAVAQVQDLKQIASETGNVEPVSSVSLAFEQSGKVSSINADVGSHVSSGEVLATLSNADLQASLAEAKANVQAQQAKLDALIAGNTPQSIQVAQVQLENAQAALAVAKKAVSDAIRSTGTTIDDSIRNKADEYFSNPNSAQPIFNLSASPALVQTIQNGRTAMNSILTYADTSTTNVDTTASTTVLVSQLDLAKTNLNAVAAFIGNISTAINQLIPNSNISQATIDSDKASISAARDSINAQISAVTTAENGLQTAQASVDLETSQLVETQTPARPEDIAAQQAQVAQAQASVQNAQAQLDKTILLSPIPGVVTAKNADVGEIVTVNSPVFSIISDGNFDIETYVPESDIANIQVGDVADLTLDAYPDMHWSAKVISVDPGETITQGVATYKVKLEFTSPDSRIKPGMTANLDITTAEVQSALVIPSRAVADKSDGTKTVQILQNGKPLEVQVTTGIKDGAGHIQILTGLNEGETVIVSGGSNS